MTLPPEVLALTPWLGLAILGLVGYDVYATILHTRARAGPISETCNRVVWNGARTLAFRLSRRQRHRLLNAVGPLLLPLLIAVLVFLLTTGFALIYYPSMPAGFHVAAEARRTPWIDAYYFSGITLTTLGYGDIAPWRIGMRLIALSEATVGFVLISLSVTYLITVATALERKRIVALSFYHQAQGGADVAGLIAHYFLEGRFYGLEQVCSRAARDLQGLLESHVEHPVIQFFHPIEVHKSLPRTLFIALETCAVLRTCVNASSYPTTCRHPEVKTLEETAQHVLVQLSSFLGHRRSRRPLPEAPAADPERWATRFERTVARLQQAGIQTRVDLEAGRRAYARRRRQWEGLLGDYGAYLGYDWDEVTGDHDLAHATVQIEEED